MKDKVIPSLIKWTGSKRLQAKYIIKEIPSYNTYIEPFLGGGSMLYLNSDNAIVGDIYKPLIDLWLLVKDNPNSIYIDYKEKWENLQKDTPGYYYTIRSNFNQDPNPYDLNFLMRTCVNGIVRFNSKGEFNNSFHLSRKGMNPKRFKNIIMEWHNKIQNTVFMCQDYQSTIEIANSGDFVYLDPPYANTNARYIEQIDLEKFFGELEMLNRRDVKWALSFDGIRGQKEFTYDVPEGIYKRKILIPSGKSALGKVLNKVSENVF